MKNKIISDFKVGEVYLDAETFEPYRVASFRFSPEQVQDLKTSQILKKQNEELFIRQISEEVFENFKEYNRLQQERIDRENPYIRALNQKANNE